jgi:fructuronate reductase
MPEKIRSFVYDRDGVTAGILHFGVGNFHRAHQAVYCDDLLNSGATQWGITGVSLRSSSMQDALKPQDYVYTLATLGEKTEYRIIGAIKDILVAPNEPQAVIDLIAKNTTHLISSTITEKGYYIASGQIDYEQSDLQAELASLQNPTTIYGFLARGIIQRYRSSGLAPKLTVMCCDNISAGGEFLKDGILHLLKRHSPEAHNWAQNNVSFVSSMVDRVCPATDDTLRERVSKETGREDAWPVSCEPFSQWIIEGNFAGKRPEFEHVGAVFVDDIAPFETMKLRYLNAAHTLVSTIGHLFGDRFVHETLKRAEVFKFMRQTLYENILPNAAVPKGYDGAVYIEDVIERFQNGNLPYANLQVGTDSSQKIQQRWFPTIDHALSCGRDTAYFGFCLAAWAIFIQTSLENNVLNDPKKAELEQIDPRHLDQMISSYLKIADADKFNFYHMSDFMKAITKQAENIRNKGIKIALSEFLTTQQNTGDK